MSSQTIRRVLVTCAVIACIHMVLIPSVSWGQQRRQRRRANPYAQAPYGDSQSKVNLNQTVYTATNAPQTPKLESLELSDTISQYGITWKLDKKVRVGRFITGDYYFVGSATVVSRTPAPLFGDEVKKAGWEIVNRQAVKEDRTGKPARNGSILNLPLNTEYSGLDSRIAGSFYKPALFQKPPFKMKPGDSLIASVSNKDMKRFTGHGYPLADYAVLTCLKKPVPADAFRPSYADTSNRIHLARNLHRQLLHNLPRPSSAPDLEFWVRRYLRPWIDTVAWGYAAAVHNQPRYGQWFAQGASVVSLMLQFNYPPQQKEKLLIHFVQYGIDLAGIARGGYVGWMGHGGFGGGRKWPIVFAGLMLGDKEMKSPGKSWPKVVFGEDTQTSKGKTWRGFSVAFESHPNWFKTPRELTPPSTWEKLGHENYRRCCTSKEWPGQALAARMMRAEKFWDHNPFFDYVDRWMTEDLEETERLIKKDHPKFKTFVGNSRRTNRFEQEMWDKYRQNLPREKKPGR